MIEQRLAWKKFREALIRYVPIQPFLWIAFSLVFRIPIIQPVTLALEGALLVVYAVFSLIKPESIRLASPKAWIALVWLLALSPIVFLFGLRYAVIPIVQEADLNWIRWNPHGRFVLWNDLDLSNVDDETNACVIASFSGDLDGNEKIIEGLRVPLFCMINTGGIVGDLKIKNVNIRQGLNVGSVAKENKGTISNVDVEGTVMGGGNIGGLAGIHRGLIESSRFQGRIEGLYVAGGLVGLNIGTIRTSQTDGTGEAQANLGGIVGWLLGGIVEDCVSDMDLAGAQWTGGVVGRNDSDDYGLLWGPIRRVVVLGSLDGTHVGVLDGNQRGSGIGTLYGGIILSEDHEFDEFEGVWYVLDQSFAVPETYRIDVSIADDFFYTEYLKLDPAVWDWNTESGIPVLR